MREQTWRTIIRQLYASRCGYCGVREEEAGTELEIDHFQPRTAGGRDDLDNLIYCCSTCNRLKGDFWPAGDPDTAVRRLLHPKRDDLSRHLRQMDNGEMMALTETGAFHLERLRLNRAPLVALRRQRQEVERLRQQVVSAQAEQAQLQQRIMALERGIEEVLVRLARLLEP